MKRVHIVAAIILNPQQTHIFITKRLSDKHQGGLWEFPGGKVEAQESTSQAIIRELDEELGITATQVKLFDSFEYDYVDKSLYFDFLLITEFEQEPYGREGQEGRWVKIKDLTNYQFPTANQPIVTQVIADFS